VEEMGVRDRVKTVVTRPAVVGVASRARLVGLAVLLAMPFGAAAGCADQGEGERCTYFSGGDAGENGSNECAAGLTCKLAASYSTSVSTGGAGTVGVCCPSSGTASTSPACNQTTGGSTTGGPPSGDGSFDASPDSQPDAGADAHLDTSTSDAPTSSDGHPSSEGGGQGDALAEASADAAHDALPDATLDAAGDAPKDVGQGG
jgi:hypothetical protein